ncbi:MULTISPECIES: hydroxyacylglutathione hydrolase [Methylotenera]|uniref:hydroxyacylglutathione hydrolase n=1 Tax=Methylotenera TaxID=359407 RepID=UPI000378C6D6|nr:MULTISPECIES: hydroxyacylglutathione hydrolase [Methylotenera]
MLHIIPIPAFTDNYIWLLHNKNHAVVIDPGDAQPVIDALKKNHLKLSAILITHHHNDHIGGVSKLLEYAHAKVYAPKYETFAFKHIALAENDLVDLPEIDLNFRVMWLPGHTLGHIAYYNDDLLFCGDTLFSAGCGRLFEGTPEQMLRSLNQLKQLNSATKVYCTHEYTAKNIAFALTLEPDNEKLIARQAIVERLRDQQLPSLPSTIELELEINPFLRCNQTTIRQNSQAKTSDELAVFTTIRALRNHY